MGGQQRDQPQLGSGQRRLTYRPSLRDLVDPLVQSARSHRERAQVRALPQDAARLLEHGAGTRRVDECQVGPGQLDQSLDRDDGQRIREEGAQACGSPSVLARLTHVPSMRRRPCGGGEDQGTGPVPVERTAGHHLERPFDERLGGRPLLALDGDQDLLGEDQGRDGRALDARGEVVGMGERRVGSVEVALEQIREALGVEHRGAVGTGGAEPLQRFDRIAAHRGRAVPAQVRPQVGQRRPHRAAVGQRAGRRKRLGDRGPPLAVSWPAEQTEDQCSVGDHRRRVRRGRATAQPFHPALDRLDLTAGPDRLHRPEDQPAEQRLVAGQVRVVDRVLRLAVLLEPRRRTGVQLLDEVGRRAPELGLELLAQQSVVAEPLALTVVRQHEQIPALQLFEHLGRAGAIQHGIS